MWTLFLCIMSTSISYIHSNQVDKFYSPTQHPNHPLAICQVRPILCNDCRISYIFLGVAKVLRVPGIEWKVDVHTRFLHVSCFGTEKKLCQVLCRWTWPHSRPCPVFCCLQYLTYCKQWKAAWVGPGDEPFMWSQTQNQPSADHFQYFLEDTHWMKLRSIWEQD